MPAARAGFSERCASRAHGMPCVGGAARRRVALPCHARLGSGARYHVAAHDEHHDGRIASSHVHIASRRRTPAPSRLSRCVRDRARRRRVPLLFRRPRRGRRPPRRGARERKPDHRFRARNRHLLGAAPPGAGASPAAADRPLQLHLLLARFPVDRRRRPLAVLLSPPRIHDHARCAAAFRRD